MAKIDREFLVPYLKDVCTLHLVDEELSSRIDDYESEYEQLNWEVERLKRPTPYTKESYGGQIFGYIVAVLAFILGGLDIPLVSGFMKFCGIVILIGATIMLFSTMNKNSEMEQAYNEKLRKYTNERNRCTKKLDERSPVIVEEHDKYVEERERLAEVLEKVYSANVIPGHYRNMYAAVYLYNWFSTSNADDLDMALNTFVLEQIKERLDIIIEQQYQILINQKRMLLNQEYAIQEQERHHREMTAKLEQLQVTAEEQNRYLHMIEANTAANAYFSAAYYLKDL